MAPQELIGDGFDPEGRMLCPDGGCIGLIGPDGRCKVCGLPGIAADPHPGPLPQAGEGGRIAESGPEVAAIESDDSGGGDGPSEFTDRDLCRDETCIGVIGPDGRCKVCGLSAS